MPRRRVTVPTPGQLVQHLRAVLHHQRPRPRHRAGSVDLSRAYALTRWKDHRRKLAGTWIDLCAALAACAAAKASCV